MNTCFFKITSYVSPWTAFFNNWYIFDIWLDFWRSEATNLLLCSVPYAVALPCVVCIAISEIMERHQVNLFFLYRETKKWMHGQVIFWNLSFKTKNYWFAHRYVRPLACSGSSVIVMSPAEWEGWEFREPKLNKTLANPSVVFTTLNFCNFL